MISRRRMKFDVGGQFLLLFVVGIISLLNGMSNVLLGWILLFGWQLLSAFLLYVQFDYQQRKAFLWIGLAGIPLAFIGAYWLGLFLLGFALCYLYYTVLDTIKVLRRPKSFWDLG